MPPPMPIGSHPTPPAGVKPPTPFNFNSNAPGGGAQVAGYNQAMSGLNNALKLSGQTTQAGQMQLGNQLQQQQGALQQNLASRGLGNTTVAATMAQAPIQSYNLGMAQLNDLSAQRQMQAYGNLANLTAQGGNAITATDQPYAQTNFVQQKMQQMAHPGPQMSPAIQLPQPQAPQQQPQGQLYYGAGSFAGSPPASSSGQMTPEAQAMLQNYIQQFGGTAVNNTNPGDQSAIQLPDAGS